MLVCGVDCALCPVTLVFGATVQVYFVFAGTIVLVSVPDLPLTQLDVAPVNAKL
jgi:hypothetical protein